VTLLLLFNKAARAGAIVLGSATDFELGISPRPEYIYVGTEALNNELTEVAAQSVHKFQIALPTHAANGQGRLRQLIGVSNGIVHVQGTVGWEAFDDAADPQLSANASFYWYVQVAGKVFIGDGISAAVFDPKKGTLAKFEAVGAGEVPQKAYLACAYRKRLVLAADTKWYMSAANDPFNWEYFPPIQTVADAVADSTVAQFSSDIIHTLIPGQDDYLYFGCSGSILLLRGDPLNGGQLDIVSEDVGMSFGNSWAKDQNGVIYFFASRGGVYRMVPGGLPESISDASGSQDVTVQADFEAINQNDYRLELEWDYNHDELIVSQIPYATENLALIRSWRWSRKLNAWWPDRLGSTGLIPFSSWSADGDLATDRTIIFGCQDGYVRSLNDLVNNDDEVAIDAYVTIGPIQSGSDRDTAIGRIKAILAHESGGCSFEVFSTDAPSLAEGNDPLAYASLVASGSFEPGQNPRISVRARGPYLWIRLRNNKQNEGFAVEELGASLTARGTRRVH
jgi:hypothetical protein